MHGGLESGHVTGWVSHAGVLGGIDELSWEAQCSAIH